MNSNFPNISSQRITKFVNCATEIIETYPHMDESNTKTKIIEPFLELLNWNIIYDFELEYSVTETESVDYGLISNSDLPKLCIEAKRIQQNLNDDCINQLKYYMKNGNFEYGLLTNGQEYNLYTYNDNEFESVYNIKLHNFTNRINELKLISKNNINDSHYKTNQILQEKNAKRLIITNRDEIINDISNIIVEYTNNSIKNQSKIESKKLINRLLNTQKLYKYNINNKKSVSKKVPLNEFWKLVDEKIDIINVVDTEEEYEIKFIGENKSAREHYKRYFEFLYNNNFIINEDIPIKSNGNVLYILNYEPTNQDGSDMRAFKKISRNNSSDLYLYTHGDIETFKNKMFEFAQKYTY